MTSQRVRTMTVVAAVVALGLLPPLAGAGGADATPPAGGAPAASQAPVPPSAADAAAKALEAGDPAPPFRLAGSDGKTYALADFKGKKAVVLAWFPKAFTGG